MNVKVDITLELEAEIRRRIHPAEPVTSFGGAFLWNLKAQTLTANMKLANGVYGEKSVSINAYPADELVIAICLAFEFVEFIRKEGKRQVAPEKPTEEAK